MTTRSRRSYRPSMEELEDRTVPSYLDVNHYGAWQLNAGDGTAAGNDNRTASYGSAGHVSVINTPPTEIARFSTDDWNELLRKYPAPWTFTYSTQTLANNSLVVKGYSALGSGNQPGAEMFLQYNQGAGANNPANIFWIQIIDQGIGDPTEAAGIPPIVVDPGGSTPFYGAGSANAYRTGFTDQTFKWPSQETWTASLFVVQQTGPTSVLIWQGIQWGLYTEAPAPQADDDHVSTAANTAVTIPVLANDQIPAGDTVSVSSYGTPSYGSLAISSNVFTYTPYSYVTQGNDSFPYTISDGTNTSTATVYVTIDPVTQFTINGPSSVTAGGSFVYTVTALDASNSTSTSYNGTVEFNSSDPQATLPPDATLVNGVGTFSATLGTSGSQSFNASDLNDPGAIGSDTVTVNPGNATKLTVVTNGATGTGSLFVITVTALDPYGNIATGYNGTVNVTSSDPSASISGNAMLLSGVGIFSATLQTSGTQSVTATDTSNSGINGTCDALQATHFSITSTTSVTAGDDIQFTVTALDANNNVATGYNGLVQFTSSDGQALLPDGFTLVDGVGTSDAILLTSGTESITVTSAANSSTHGTASITVAAASLDHFYVSGTDDTVNAGDTSVIYVTAVDQYGNTVTAFSGSADFTSSDAGAILPGVMHFTSGVGSFSATLTTAGNQSITVIDAANSAISGSASNITVNPGAVAQFTFTGVPDDEAGGATEWEEFEVTAFAVDAFGNMVNSFNGSVTYSSDDSWISWNMPVAGSPGGTFSSGSLTINITFSSGGAKDNGGSCSVTLTSNDDGSITGSFTVSVNPPSGG